MLESHWHLFQCTTYKHVTIHYSKDVFVRLENESKYLASYVPHISYFIPKKKTKNPFPEFTSSGPENTVDLTKGTSCALQATNHSEISVNENQNRECLVKMIHFQSNQLSKLLITKLRC